ncbi:uncharacterized protein LOC115921765 [Strongylocentrotus purpuratus]|uniref:Tudor domain-containing protein n=1 Tax=Strongylocentrotus purpuratus TaxID=7668 RepID=A0A7M7SW43_STRPU|nr:uncharacterized protein LOC115921765 [Strongylocentrotus purpuratus]
MSWSQSLKPGDVVNARWKDCRWYAAIIQESLSDGCIRVRFEDGIDHCIRMNLIRPCVEKPTSDELEKFTESESPSESASNALPPASESKERQPSDQADVDDPKKHPPCQSDHPTPSFEMKEISDDEISISSGSEYVPESQSESDCDDDISSEEVIPLPQEISITRKEYAENQLQAAVDHHRITESKTNCTEGTSSSSHGQNKGKITVMTTQNIGGKRCYDKIDFCLFCQVKQSKLRVHLKQHQSERLVAEYLGAASSQERNKLMSKIRNMGNHQHNCKVCRSGEGMIVPIYRPNYEARPDDYQPCPNCLGWYNKNEMWKHLCKEKGKSGYIRGVNVRAGRLLRPLPTTVTSRYARVLAGLRSDVVSLCIRNDDTITALGEQLCFKLGHSRENDNVIRCEIRAVARLLLEFRSMSGNKDAEASSLIAPASFQDTIKAARKLCEFDEETQLYKKPSYSIKVGHSLKKMALILVSKALMTESNDLEKKQETS